MMCNNCGKENSHNSKICSQCGEEFDVQTSYPYVNNAQLLLLFFLPIVLVLAAAAAISGTSGLNSYIQKMLYYLVVGLLPIVILFILFRFTRLRLIAQFNHYLERGSNLFLTFMCLVLVGFLGNYSVGFMEKAGNYLPSRFADNGENSQSPKDDQTVKCVEKINSFVKNKIEPDNAFYSECGAFDIKELLSKTGRDSYEITYSYTYNNVDFNFDYPLGSKVNLQQIGSVRLQKENDLDLTFKVFRKELFHKDILVKESRLIREYSVNDLRAKEYLKETKDGESINTLIELEDATLLVSTNNQNYDLYKSVVSSIR